MVTGCVYCGILELRDAAFIHDVLELLIVVAPGALCLTLWRIFVTNRSGPSGGIVTIGLDDSSVIYPNAGSNVSNYARLAYCFTGLSTFALGVLTSEVFKFFGSSNF
jgi:hypothetical protein